MAKYLTIFLIFHISVIAGQFTHAQILHTENFNVILDTTKTIKGSFFPSFRYRNVKEDLIEIENTADISIRLGRNGISVANKFEFAKFGEEELMSGGFLFLEYKRVVDTNKFLIEPYALMLWQEVRGLDIKYAGGVNLRWRVLYNDKIGLFSGIGAIYENETWNYEGTSDTTLIPADPTPIVQETIRGSAYMNLKKEFGDLFSLDLSVYYQPMFSDPFEEYRLASSSELTLNFNEHIGLTVLYQNIYDPLPIVPIDKIFHDLNLGLTLSF